MSRNTIDDLISKLHECSPKMKHLIIDFKKSTQAEEDIKEHIKEIQEEYFANKKPIFANGESLSKLSQLHEEVYNICDKKIKLFQEIYKELDQLSREPAAEKVAKLTESYCVCGKDSCGAMIQCDKV